MPVLNIMSPIFTVTSIIVPVVIYWFLPPLLMRLTGKKPVSRAPLAIACLLFFIAWYVPSPLIRGMDTNFSTHFVGGGLFTGFLWMYIRNFLRLPIGRQDLPHRSAHDLVILYVLVNALGVANELFEFAAVESGFANLDPSDTWWDLLANNLGVLVFWAGDTIHKIWG